MNRIFAIFVITVLLFIIAFYANRRTIFSISSTFFSENSEREISESFYRFSAPEKNPNFIYYPKCEDSAQVEVLVEIEKNMIKIKEGSFLLGNNLFKSVSKDSSEYFRNEYPAHRVKVPQFYLSKFEVTQLQYQAIMGTNPSETIGSKLPVEKVKWENVIAFINRLNYLSGKNYRLPSEAEWEYANRAGNSDPHYPIQNNLSDYEWYRDNSDMLIHPVGMKFPNTWGLYDMNGNVSEWCSDDWTDSFQKEVKTAESYVNIKEETNSVQRGGNFRSKAEFCRASNRFNYTNFEGWGLGFRLALNLENNK